jgi:acetyltransferase-like isoleucine patch superfamily enzyme
VPEPALPGRPLAWDWFAGVVPATVAVHPSAYIESTYSFQRYRSELVPGIVCGRGSATYHGTMFDVGPAGRVRIGELTMLNAARIICDTEMAIGDRVLVSWDVVIMDSERRPAELRLRLAELRAVATRTPRRLESADGCRPVRIEDDVWIGFGACILPGVTVGRGSVVGARSVVGGDVPPFTVVAGNPARVVRELPPLPAPDGG